MRNIKLSIYRRSHDSFFESRSSDPVQEKMQRSLEQRMAIKFCVKLEKRAAETIPMLKKAFRRLSFGQANFPVAQGHRRRSGKMSTTRTALDGHRPPVPTTM
ncbi:hypothetical protein NQ318_011031 [Aromia moschata]|uniref:Uncharacterized protein n=1 Tax=Aromia moschata TaxID=1265417 RepID=A0AAV8YTM1_9CUCU|nr:hypothetical protein NQ318_011031 [Aromia moschata]